MILMRRRQVGKFSTQCGRRAGMERYAFANRAGTVGAAFVLIAMLFVWNRHNSPQAKADKAVEWRAHLQRQYMDRSLYMQCRRFSRLKTFGLVTIIIDAMDKVKGTWPQFKFRRPKSLDRFNRPKLRITAAYAHGFGCFFYICHDEITPGGASFYCEVLSRTVQHIKKICVDKRLRFPDQLVLQSDNTTAQAKNSETLRYLAQLVGRGIFSVVILNFLIVGHTHEDIDRIFAYLRSAVIKKHLFQTPQEFCEYILLEMPAFFARYDEVVQATLIGDICDFDLWLEGQAVH